MDEDALSCDILPPDALPPSPSAQSVALARRISKGVPSADLQALLYGPIGDAVAEAAGYADEAIAESTRAAYVKAWDHFADWCRGKEVDPDALPLNPVLVAAYLSALAKTHGASALRSRVAAIAYHHRRRGFVFLPAHPVLRETMSGIRRRHPKRVGRQRRCARRRSSSFSACARPIWPACAIARCFWWALPALSGARSWWRSIASNCASRQRWSQSTCRAARATKKGRGRCHASADA